MYVQIDRVTVESAIFLGFNGYIHPMSTFDIAISKVSKGYGTRFYLLARFPNLV